MTSHAKPLHENIAPTHGEHHLNLVNKAGVVLSRGLCGVHVMPYQFGPVEGLGELKKKK